jgi:WD40 repeat protein
MSDATTTQLGSFDLPGPQPDAVWPTVPGFEVLAVLGQGGMGVVYKALQRSLNRFVAIKTILPGIGAEGLARFQVEAEATAKLNHPHLVAVYEVGNLAPAGKPPAPFLVMEFVGGGTLDKLLDNTPQSANQSAELMATLADAVQHAHDHGIVHRDIKPANVLLAEGKSPPWPKISDFGLAKSLERPIALTVTGAIMGTPGYMAPEQARGEESVGPAADIYALGTILYQMITGRPPFLGATALDTLHQVLHDDPVAPRQLVPSIPKDLETICLKCLEKEPKKRYASCRELAADLRRFLAGEPTLARPPGWLERSVRWVRRNPTLATLIIVSTVAVLTMLVGSYLNNQSLRRAYRNVQRSEEEGRRALVRLGVEQGMSCLDDGHAALALSWFASTLELGCPEEQLRQHRIRYGTTLRTLPQLAHMWVHNAPLRVALFSPDGKRVLMAGDAGTAHLRDVDTGKDWVTMKHPSAVTCAVFGKDGCVVLGGGKGQVRVHFLGRREAVSFSPGHSAAVSTLEALPGGLVLSASADKTAGLWRVADGKPVFAPWKHPKAVLAASANFDGSRIATACADGRVRLFDGKSGSPVGKPLEHPTSVHAIAWHPKGELLATGCADGSVRLWGADGKTRFMRNHRATVVQVAFSPDGQRLVSASDDSTARIWAVSNGYELAVMRHTSGINGATFSPNGLLVLTTGDDNTARVWTVGGEAATPWLPQVGSVQAACFSPDGKMVLTGSVDHSARLWRLRPEQASPSWEIGAWQVVEPPRRWDGPDRLVLVRVSDHAAKLLEEDTGKMRGLLRHGSTVLFASFLSDGTRLVTGSDDNMARVWDTKEAALIGRALPHRSSVHLASFNADGTLVATASADLCVRVWGADSGLPLTPPWRVAAQPKSLHLEEDVLRVKLENGTEQKFSLAPAEEDVKELQRQATLFAGRRAGPLEGITVLSPEQMIELLKE